MKRYVDYEVDDVSPRGTPMWIEFDKDVRILHQYSKDAMVSDGMFNTG